MITLINLPFINCLIEARANYRIYAKALGDDFYTDDCYKALVCYGKIKFELACSRL